MGNLKSKLGKSKGRDKKADSALPESSSAKKSVDPRLPFTNYRQVFSVRNAWKAVARRMEETSKECLIRFFEKFPNWKSSFVNLADLTTEVDMRNSDEFETVAIEFFQVFDDVVSNLENVDAALSAIHRTKKTWRFTQPILKDMKAIFMDTLKQLLGERMTEITEQNYELLYDFVRAEMENTQS